MELVWVPGGAFDFGEPALAEQPANSLQWLQTVDVPGFWMGTTPVTQSQWKRVMGTNPSLFRKGENYPVENISWEDALDFIRRLADMSANRFVLTLPTEVQWQYAATVGGQVDGYGVAADIDQFAWYGENSGMSPQPVGMKRSNAFGLYDMLGNVMEWCSDNALEEIYRTGRRRTSVYADVGAKQPGRGGCWKSDQTDCFPAHQRLFTQRLGYSTLGMRLVRLNLSADMFTDGSRSRE
jgi:formylglycine-generating enzyme required for sulfatase activity